MNLKGLSPDSKIEAKETAADIIIEEINSFLDASKSPVAGGTYRKRKVDGSNSQLFEEGDMRISLEAIDAGENKIELGVFEPDQTRKAYGHNTGFKGHPNEAKMKKHKREFIPAPNKKFKASIMKKVNAAIEDIRETQDNLTVAQLTEAINQVQVSSEASLGDLFSQIVFSVDE